MADYRNIRPQIQKWEGGLSRATTDTASANPAPWSYNGTTGWHTNKGVTYSTFISLSPLLKYPATSDNFFVMPDTIWNLIFKRGYWDTFNLDKMNSQVVADTIAQWSWGSGPNGALSSIKKYLATKGITVSDRDDVVQAFNQLVNPVNEKAIFLELIDWREAFFRSLGQPANLNGWLNRLADFKQFGLQTLIKKKIKLIAIGVVIIVLIVAAIAYATTD